MPSSGKLISIKYTIVHQENLPIQEGRYGEGHSTDPQGHNCNWHTVTTGSSRRGRAGVSLLVATVGLTFTTLLKSL